MLPIYIVYIEHRAGCVFGIVFLLIRPWRQLLQHFEEE